MIVTYFDTETTGLPKGRQATPIEEGFPHPVQFAMLMEELQDELLIWQEVGQVAVVVDSPLEIGAKAMAVHGISPMRAKSAGVSLKALNYLFGSIVKKSDLLVCHNKAFDLSIMRSVNAFVSADPYRADRCFLEAVAGKTFCTMICCEPILKIPSPWGKGYKWPRLEEVYESFFDKKLEGPHDALVDAKATRDIFHYLVENNLLPDGFLLRGVK